MLTLTGSFTFVEREQRSQRDGCNSLIISRHTIKRGRRGQTVIPQPSWPAALLPSLPADPSRHGEVSSSRHSNEDIVPLAIGG